MIKNIGFVATRFAGNDGVSLEAEKWAKVFEDNGHRCFWMAGELDKCPENSLYVPEAHFQHESNIRINNQVFGNKKRNPSVTRMIHEIRSLLKVKLHEFINMFDIDMIIAENSLTIPMHIPLGLALTETIAETQLPTIAHHHDFYWERVRFSVNSVNDYIRMAFPPYLPNIKHIVINSESQEQLAHRTGISSTIIPNVLDFENPPVADKDRAKFFKKSIGLEPDDIMILQPTRIVQRKGIEHAVQLVRELKDPRYKLVISHEAGDEGYDYVEWLKGYACEQNVDLRLVATSITDPEKNDNDKKNHYSLWDIYPFADLITYPSSYEGFGNAFLEAIYFKKPILINRYATFVRDIEPRGFDLLVMDGFLTKKTVKQVMEILGSKEKRKNMVNLNYDIAKRYYSYAVLRREYNKTMIEFFGDEVQRLAPKTHIMNDVENSNIKLQSVQYSHFAYDGCK